MFQCNCTTKDGCSNSMNITRAAFLGNSYIRQLIVINEAGTVQVDFKLRTFSTKGTIMHIFFDEERYVLLYLESGQLKFQFSCGQQTALLGEIDNPVNNGYKVQIEMR